ncbi:hypothetical protein PP501_gp69 [Gordonia phage Powerball]|uniref:Uncharacterized protein n=1 Tax=Gordonia phage Powerball TaxID=2599847 RepID=A0A5J6TRW2_9CAUD|nr:hypothetical protein PP501_gp69 [Gordonia phage Powerball]QFG13501.1 hypothetical protein PBI_POWERBALL_69 [Gordonia phage Powerball]
MTNPATISHSPTEAMRDYERHRDTRARDRSGTNHAGQTTAECIACHTTFDVGETRAAHPTFRPICTPECLHALNHHRFVRHDDTTRWCACGWFTSATEPIAEQRLAAHRQRVTRNAA